MEAVDNYIPTPERAMDKPFLMPIEDVFGIKGRGHGGDGADRAGAGEDGGEVEIVGITATRQDDGDRAWRCSRRRWTKGRPGTTSGCLLRGIEREDVQRGQVLAQAGVDQAAHEVRRREVYVLSKEEGGRHTPFFPGYRPQFYIRTTDVTGSIELPEGVEMVMPGDNIQMEVELIQPVAIEEGLRFAIREGGRTVGAGVVTRSRTIAGLRPAAPSSRCVPSRDGQSLRM